MSKNKNRISKEALEHQESNSVYDFLYHDVRRVGAYLAQIDPSGHLLSVKQTVSTEESEQQDAGGSAGATLLGLAKADTQFSDRVTSGAKDAAERTFDPLWTNATTLLTYLQQRNLLNTSLLHARFGQFVLIKGSMTILDMGLLKHIWTIPEVQEGMKAGAQAGAGGSLTPIGETNVRVLIQLLPTLPHAAQCLLVTDDKMILWTLLSEESLVGTVSDLGLKHGMSIDGEWYILGVLDSKPAPTHDAHNNFRLSESTKIAINGMDMVAELVKLMPSVRSLGRPPSAYGATPLLIFRKIGL